MKKKKNVEDPFQAVKRENQNLWCLHRVRKDKGFHTERHETKDAWVRAIQLYC